MATLARPSHMGIEGLALRTPTSHTAVTQRREMASRIEVYCMVAVYGHCHPTAVSKSTLPEVC